MTYCFLVQMILWTIFKLLLMIFGHGCTFQHLVFNGFYTFDLFDDAGANGLFTWSKVQNFLQNVQLQKFCKKSANILQIFLQQL